MGYSSPVVGDNNSREGLKGVALLEKVCHWVTGFEVSSLHHSQLALCA